MITAEEYEAIRLVMVVIYIKVIRKEFVPNGLEKKFFSHIKKKLKTLKKNLKNKFQRKK